MFCAEEACTCLRHGANDGERVVSQRHAAIARGITDLQDDVADRSEVEGVRLDGQLEVPAADCAEAFERQVSLVAKIELEHPIVVLRGARRDRLRAGDAVAEARIVCRRRRARVVRLPGARGLRTDGVLHDRERGVNSGVRTDDGRNRHAHALEPAHVVPRAVAVIQPFRD